MLKNPIPMLALPAFVQETRDVGIGVARMLPDGSLNVMQQPGPFVRSRNIPCLRSSSICVVGQCEDMHLSQNA